MEWYNKLSEFLVKFKDIVTTVVSFVPLVYVIIDTYQAWVAGGTASIGALLVTLAVAIVGWFTGKK